jgi:hypothetical protein
MIQVHLWPWSGVRMRDRGPAQGLFEESEGVFQVEAAQEGSP